MHKILLTAASLLLASVALAEVLDKASSFSIEQDALTGNWNLECSSEVSGIDRTLDHFVGADLRISDGTSSIQIFNATLNILAAENKVVRTLDRIDYEIKKAGTRLKVSLDVSNYYPAGTGNSFTCTISITEGINPGGAGDTLYGVRMQQAINNAGTP